MYCTWYQVQYSSTNGQTTEQIRSIPKQQRMPKMAFLVATTVPMNTSSTIETHQPNNQPQMELATNYLYRFRRIDLIFSVLRIFTTLSAISDLWRRVLLHHHVVSDVIIVVIASIEVVARASKCPTIKSASRAEVVVARDQSNCPSVLLTSFAGGVTRL